MFLVPSLVLVVIATTLQLWLKVAPTQRLDADARTALISELRRGLEADPVAPEPASSGEPMLVVSVWHRGVEIGRVQGRGSSEQSATTDAARALGALAISKPVAKEARIKVDRIVGDAPFLRSLPGLGLFSLHPGVDGLRAESPSGDVVFLLPHDLVRERVLTAETPLSFIPDVKVGLDIPGIEKLAAARLGMSPTQLIAKSVSLRRMRTDAFVEAALGSRTTDGSKPAPIPLYRGWAPRPTLSSAALRSAAIEGGRFLVEHIAESGRYIYEIDLPTGHRTDPRKPRPYSLPRHAGTTYFLAELYRITAESFLREPIERAFSHLSFLVGEGGCQGESSTGQPFTCVLDKGAAVASLGSTALTVVALAEYKRATGKGTYDQLARELTEWMLFMQRPDGSFRHLYNVKNKAADESAQLLYFSGEATLALARMYEVYREPRYLDATERALDYLIGWYDFFAGSLFYGEEHWTCIAAEAAWPHLTKTSYRDFCHGYGDYLRLQQPTPTSFGDSPDLAGTYGFTPFLLPNNTPAGSRTEAMISAYLLGLHHQSPQPEIRQQIKSALHFTLSQQLTADTVFWTPHGEKAIGGITASPIEPSVRIDYVQHVCSAMIRAAEMLERHPDGG